MLNNHYKDKGIDYDFSIDEVVKITEEFSYRKLFNLLEKAIMFAVQENLTKNNNSKPVLTWEIIQQAIKYVNIQDGQKNIGF
jgi:SpoVK/Ycf46/Vps4 family AAA+-type ATPase